MRFMDKFSAVEIKADNRISEDDKAFCVCQQAAFDKAGPALQKIADLMATGKDEQRAILAVDDDHFYNPYMSGDGFSCDEDKVYRAMTGRNNSFISIIVQYFSRKYNVELDSREIMKHLIPVAPKKPELPWGGYRNMSDDAVDAFQEKLAVYKSEKAAYDAALRTLPLRYEQIVEEIFAQLGGFSFAERSMNELLKRCWDASHSRNWRSNETEESFECKGDTLRLTGYWCRCRDDSWRSTPDWEPAECLKVILDAAAHYECGRMKEGCLWFPELFRYSTNENLFEICNMEKIKAIKLFKNGRVDIKFRNSLYAQEFVEQYLRRNIA